MVCWVDDFYFINGFKVFILGVGSIDLLVVMVCIGGFGVCGVLVIVVLGDIFGISYGKKESKMGWNSQFMCIISFDNVKVLVGNLLGEEGEGFVFVMKGFDGGCINIVICLVGVVQVVLDVVYVYMKECKQFGCLIVDFQVL